MGLQFVDATKVQHAARAATLEQSKSGREAAGTVWDEEKDGSWACSLGIKLALEEFSALNLFGTKSRCLECSGSLVNFLKSRAKRNIRWTALSLLTVLADAIEFHARQGLHEVAKKRVEFFMLWNAKVEPCVALPTVLADAIEFHARQWSCQEKGCFFMLCNAKVQSLKDTEYELRKSMDATVEAAVRGERIVCFLRRCWNTMATQTWVWLRSWSMEQHSLTHGWSSPDWHVAFHSLLLGDLVV